MQLKACDGEVKALSNSWARALKVLLSQGAAPWKSCCCPQVKAFEEKVKALSEAKAKALTVLDAEMKSLRATQEEIMHKFDEAVQALQPVSAFAVNKSLESAHLQVV